MGPLEKSVSAKERERELDWQIDGPSFCVAIVTSRTSRARTSLNGLFKLRRSQDASPTQLIMHMRKRIKQSPDNNQTWDRKVGQPILTNNLEFKYTKD